MKLESDNVFHVYYEDEGEDAREIWRSHSNAANHSGKHKCWIYKKESAPTETTWTTQAWHSYLGLEGVWMQWTACATSDSIPKLTTLSLRDRYRNVVHKCKLLCIIEAANYVRAVALERVVD